MSARIHQLNPHVVNRIAAGEVVERPASVVKELLENSVDALATRVEADIESGGQELIRITDNGEGIHADDLELAVTSHATSKIRSDADLDQVATLGFRGEALASIAAVSRFCIRTRPTNVSIGREVESTGGKTGEIRECGCPEGTTIEVRNLFFNTPARRRFLRKQSSEFGRISEQFSRIALANPRLHVVLRHNGRIVYELPTSANQVDRIRRFFGSELADRLIHVESRTAMDSGASTRVWGYVGEPSLSRSTRRSQFLFLNGRWIQDRSLQHALGEAYRGLLMTGRHPVCFLFLELPADQVDVNVHPTKTEVRFRDSQAVYRQLLRTLRDRFLQLEFSSAFQVPPQAASAAAASRELYIWSDSTVHPAPPAIRPTPGRPVPERLPAVPPGGPSREEARTPATSGAHGRHPTVDGLPLDLPSDLSRDEYVDGDRLSTAADAGAPEQQPESALDRLGQSTATDSAAVRRDSSGTRPEADFRAIQVHDCYLVVAGDDGLEIIDQHALHERILYENFRQRILGGQVESQRLLIPETIECSVLEAAILSEHRDLLRESGFEIHEFGGTTILLESHPVLIPRGSLVGILRDFAEQLERTDGKITRRDLLDRLLQTMSCRAAIKAGDRLTPEVMQELLRQRHLVDHSHHCPHGRPTAMKLSRNMLDRKFGRLG